MTVNSEDVMLVLAVWFRTKVEQEQEIFLNAQSLIVKPEGVMFVLAVYCRRTVGQTHGG